MTALVTGAAGFVGSALVRLLVREGMGVRALVRAGSDCRNLAGLDATLMVGDITDPASLAAAVAGCRYVFHVAADYRLWVPDRDRMLQVNVGGSVNVVDAARAAGVERLVYTSSVAVLGMRSDGMPADETTPVSLGDMIGTYKRSKFLAERAVRQRAAELGLDTVTVNPSTPIGPGDLKPTPTGRLIADAVAGRMPAYVDTGLNIVHVEDVARGHLLALEHGRAGERYILGGTDLSLREILALIAEFMQRPAPRLRLPHAPLYPIAVVLELWARMSGREPRMTVDALRMAGKHMYFSSAKAARELGYRWRPARHAIEDAVAWFAGGISDGRPAARP
jgi:dihydroflavonol-4-reductase